MGITALTLELGQRFVAEPFDAHDERLVFVDSRMSLPASQIIAADACLSRRRVLATMPGRGAPVGTIAASRQLQTVYVAGDAGIWELALEGGEPSLLVEFPKLPLASREDVQAAYGPDAHWPPEKVGKPSYRWALKLDEASKQLFALCGQEGSLDHFVRVSIDERCIISQHSLPGFCASIQVDTARKLIVLPSLRGGPQVLDFSGHRLASLREIADIEDRSFARASLVPHQEALLLTKYDGALFLWNWKLGRYTHLADDVSATACRPDGTFISMRTSAEIWLHRVHGEPELIVKALGHQGGTEFERRHSWATNPWVSPDGRYVLANFTVIRKTNVGDVAEHSVVSVDLGSRRVQQLPNNHFYACTWW